MNSQLKRGVLDICVLTTLIKEDSYGYKIIKDLSDHVILSESTLYPILKRLESLNCLTVYSVIYSNRVRRYYKITEAGRQRIFNFIEEWKSIMKIYKYIEGAIEQ